MAQTEATPGKVAGRPQYHDRNLSTNIVNGANAPGAGALTATDLIDVTTTAGKAGKIKFLYMRAQNHNGTALSVENSILAQVAGTTVARIILPPGGGWEEKSINVPLDLDFNGATAIKVTAENQANAGANLKYDATVSYVEFDA